MLKVASFDIVFQEIPGEVTLALNLSGCPCHCPGCHSKHLWADVGEPLSAELMDGILERYGSSITCVAFMGGDQAPDDVIRLAAHLKKTTSLNTAWYSGRQMPPEKFYRLENKMLASLPQQETDEPLDYIKLGPYIEAQGGLKSPKTNQRLFKRVDNGWVDITSSFWRNNFSAS